MESEKVQWKEELAAVQKPGQGPKAADEMLTRQSKEKQGETGPGSCQKAGAETGIGCLEKMMRRFEKVPVNPQDLSRNRIDYFFILAILQDTTKHPETYFQEIARWVPEEQLSFNVLYHLRRFNLDTPVKRSRWVGRVQHAALQLRELCAEGQKNYGPFNQRLARAVLRRNYRPLEWKAILTAFSQDLEEHPALQQELQQLLQQLNFTQCRIFLQNLTEDLGILRGLRKKKTFQEQLLEATASIGETLGEKKGRKKNLEEENEDLRASLEITQLQMQNLQVAMEELRQEAQLEARLEFFREMNAQRHGSLLDNFARAEQRLQQLRQEGHSIPEEIESIPLVVRMFMKFAREVGIQPLEKLGREMEVDLEQSEGYEYVGTNFTEPEEKKQVRVVGEGWEYASHLISRPVLQEVKTDNNSENKGGYQE